MWNQSLSFIHFRTEVFLFGNFTPVIKFLGLKSLAKSTSPKPHTISKKPIPKLLRIIFIIE